MSTQDGLEGLDSFGRLRISILIEVWALGFIVTRNGDNVHLTRLSGSDAWSVVSPRLLSRLHRYREALLPVLGPRR